MWLNCDICLKTQEFGPTFKTKSSLNQHMKRLHQVLDEPNCRFFCDEGECTEKFRHHTQFATHLQDVHKQEGFGVCKREFRTCAEFEQWKAVIEEDCYIQFRKQRGDTTLASGIVASYLVCSRCPSIARPKLASGAFWTDCTAFLKVTDVSKVEEECAVKVEYCLAHYGHKPGDDNALLKIPDSLRSEIASRLKRGVPPRRVFLDIRKESWRKSENGLKPKRGLFLTLNDVYNIRKEFKIDPSVSDKNQYVALQSQTNSETPAFSDGNSVDCDTELPVFCGPSSASPASPVQDCVEDVPQYSDSVLIGDKIDLVKMTLIMHVEQLASLETPESLAVLEDAEKYIRSLEAKLALPKFRLPAPLNPVRRKKTQDDAGRRSVSMKKQSPAYRKKRPKGSQSSA